MYHVFFMIKMLLREISVFAHDFVKSSRDLSANDFVVFYYSDPELLSTYKLNWNTMIRVCTSSIT